MSSSTQPSPSTSTGMQLLNRAMPDAYRAQQTQQVSQRLSVDLAQRESAEQLSVLTFRLGREWLALPAYLCQQILSPLPFHTLPHRSNRTLLGVVNVRGQLRLKVSLCEVLGLEISQATVERSAGLRSVQAYPRMMVLEKSGGNDCVDDCADVWAFDVDELYGVHSVALSQLLPAAGVASLAETCVRNVFTWHDQRVSVLEADRLFDALRGRLL